MNARVRVHHARTHRRTRRRPAHLARAARHLRLVAQANHQVPHPPEAVLLRIESLIRRVKRVGYRPQMIPVEEGVMMMMIMMSSTSATVTVVDMALFKRHFLRWVPFSSSSSPRTRVQLDENLIDRQSQEGVGIRPCHHQH